jgi:rhodanese-related sulfurtransferase
MEVLSPEKIKREGLPGGAHVLELTSERAECAIHEHFAGVECLPIKEIGMVRNRYRPEEPIVIHCDRKERCTLAAAELDRFGYHKLYRYEGDLTDLKEHGLREPAAAVAPVIGREELERVLRERTGRVHLLELVADPDRCRRTAGVKCLEPAYFEEVLRDIGRGHKVVLSCEFGIDCQAMAQVAREAGLSEVFVYKGDFADLSWLARM